MNTRTPFDWQLAVLCGVCMLGLALALTPRPNPPITDDMVRVHQGTLASYCTTYDGGECASRFDIYIQPYLGGRLVIDEPVTRYFDADALVRDVQPGMPLTVEVLKCTGMGVNQHQHIVGVRTPTHVYLSLEHVRREVGWWLPYDNGFTPHCLALSAGRS